MAHCDEGLIKIGKALKQFQANGDGVNPGDMHELIGLAEVTMWEFVCPVSHSPFGQNSYHYRGYDLYESVPDEMIICYCRKGAHKGRRNILFASGKVYRPPSKIFATMVIEDNRLRELLDLEQRKPQYD